MKEHFEIQAVLFRVTTLDDGSIEKKELDSAALADAKDENDGTTKLQKIYRIFENYEEVTGDEV